MGGQLKSYPVLWAKRGKAMGGTRLVAAWIGFAIGVGSHEFAAWGWTGIVNRAAPVQADFAPEGRAEGAMFFRGASHAAQKRSEFFKKSGRNKRRRVGGICLAPIELHPKMGTTRTTQYTGIRGRHTFASRRHPLIRSYSRTLATKTRLLYPILSSQPLGNFYELSGHRNCSRRKILLRNR